MDHRVDHVENYTTQLHLVMKEVESKLFPGEELPQDAEAIEQRAKQYPKSIEAWKKSSARCGADITLSLIHLHCKGVDLDKLKALKVAQ
jgi:hypothetical protein